MTESELVAAIAAETCYTQTGVRYLLRAVAAEVTLAVKRGEEVTMPGLGKIKPVERSARQGRNPKTGEPVAIQAKRTATFSPSKALLERLNS